MSNRERFSLEFQFRAQRDAVAVADAVLSGGIGVIEGARKLSSLAHDLVADWTADADFLVFGALDSETDHLPVGSVCDLWDPVALVAQDATVRRIESEARSEVEHACRNIIRRFTSARAPDA